MKGMSLHALFNAEQYRSKLLTADMVKHYHAPHTGVGALIKNKGIEEKKRVSVH